MKSLYRAPIVSVHFFSFRHVEMHRKFYILSSEVTDRMLIIQQKREVVTPKHFFFFFSIKPLPASHFDKPGCFLLYQKCTDNKMGSNDFKKSARLKWVSGWLKSTIREDRMCIAALFSFWLWAFLVWRLHVTTQKEVRNDGYLPHFQAVMLRSFLEWILGSAFGWNAIY